MNLKFYTDVVYVRITSEQRIMLEAIRIQKGLSFNEQIRRALAMYFDFLQVEEAKEENQD